MISRTKHRSVVEVCADCGASDPSWASINRGLLLCAECCSVHRSMGRHISQVKSLRQGTWPPSLLAMIQACTAQNVNSIWEHSLLDISAPKHLKKKPQPKDPLHPTKSEFIIAKHLRLSYVLRARRDEPANELGKALHAAVRSAALHTAARLLAQGADPNYYHEEKGSSCLHVACRAGQATQAELLAAWGASPVARDSNGLLPHEAARVGGHIELSERMQSLVHEATNRLSQFVRRLPGPPARGLANDQHQMTDVAKAARGKLQLLPNHLFEELVMDIYDEIDRRETEAIWQTSALGLERSGVVFLPVNPALSAPRNQGRQKLARLSASEMAALVRDTLADAARRQHIATLQPRAPLSMLSGSQLRHISQLSDDEPLYDSVASDDDYAALAPIELDDSNPTICDPVSSVYNASLLVEQSPKVELRRTASPQTAQLEQPVIESLKKELDNRDSTIHELKNQLKNLQSLVEQLTRENSELKTTSYDDNSIASQISTSLHDSPTNGIDLKAQERGKSLETEKLLVEEDLKHALKCQRPVSMYETREGPKNNWQVTKHQLTTLGSLERSLSSSSPPSPAPGPPAAPHLVQRHAELVTRAIQELWSAAREHDPQLASHGDHIKHAVNALLALFPKVCPEPELNLVLSELRSACEEVVSSCSAAEDDVDSVRAAAYQLARATKLLVTQCAPDI